MKKLLLSLILILLGTTVQAKPNAAQWLKIHGELRDTPAQNTATIELGAADEQLANELISNPCLVPEKADVELATSSKEQLNEWLDLEDEDFAEDIRLIHLSKWNATKGGTGSWPLGCNPEFPHHHSAYVYIDRDSFPNFYHETVSDADHLMTVSAGVWNVNSLADCRAKWGDDSYLDVMLDLCIEAARRRGIMHILTTDRSKANIIVSSKFIAGGTIGYAYYNNGKCGDVVKAFIDNSWKPSNLLHNICWLNSHEWCGGHCSNLNHSFTRDRGIMSYANKIPFQGFRSGDEPNWTLGPDASLPVLAKHYGTEPVPTTEDPDNPPPIPTGNFPYAVGQSHIFIYNGRVVTTVVTEIEGDDSPTMGKRIAAAMSAIPEYELKERDRTLIALVYEAAAGSTKSETESQEIVKQLRTRIVSDPAKWATVFAIADEAPTTEGFHQVWEGLTGNAALSDFFLKFLPILIQLLNGEELDLEFIIKLLLSLFSV